MANQDSSSNFERIQMFKPEVILLDFHGTLCSARWEEQVILPYVLNQMKSYLCAHWTNSTVERLVHHLRQESFEQRFASFRDDAPLIEQNEETQYERNLKQSLQSNAIQNQLLDESSMSSVDTQSNTVHSVLTNVSTPPDSDPLWETTSITSTQANENCKSDHDLNSVIAFVRWQVQHRKESDSCLQLQQLIWQQGFREKRLKVQLYDDVPEVLKKWRQANIRLFVFSTVSKTDLDLLLENTQFGNLCACFDGFFDRLSGDRLLISTYKSIATHLNVEPNRILMVTGSGKVAKTADQAGLDCILSLRPENVSLREYYLTCFESINSLSMIDFV